MKNLGNAKGNPERSTGSAWEIKFPETTEEAYVELMRAKINEFWDKIEPVEDSKPLDDFLEAFISDEYRAETRYRIKTLFKKWFVLLYQNSLRGTVSNVMLILTGEQQIGKTRFFYHLLPRELFIVFKNLPDKSTERDFNKVLMTRLLVIFRHTINTRIKRLIHWEKVKELITSPWAVWVLKYSNCYISFNRIASYVATTNETNFLPEDEGLHRRVLVVKVRHYDPELLPAPAVFWGIIKYIAHKDARYYWGAWEQEERDFFAELAKGHLKN